MLTIPSTNKLGLPVKRVTLLHSGGIGSTLVLYHLMKDIIDRNLNVGLNVVTLDNPGDLIWNQKDVHFGLSTAKKCQKLLGFDSEKLIIQSFEPHRSIDSENPQHLRFRYFDIPDSEEYPLVRKTFRRAFHRALGDRGSSFEFDSDANGSLEMFLGKNFPTMPPFKWSSNVNIRSLSEQIAAADSDGDSELAQSLIDSYPQQFFRLLCQIAGGYGLSDVIYQGNYRNPPVAVQNNFKYGFGLDYARPESTRGLTANLDSEIIEIDSELHKHIPTQTIRHWYEKRPLISKGDARDLYNNYYSQDSDLETLFWHTMSCTTWWRREYRENEIYEDSELPLEWDSNSLIWDASNNQYIYQTRQEPLHKFLPHCRKCWQCQNRGYGFEDWLDSDDDAAWLRIENINNPPPVLAPTDAIVVYDLQDGGSMAAVTGSDIKNVGTIDGNGTLLGTYVYDSDAENIFFANAGNDGILSQNIRPYVDSDGTMSVSIWFKTKRTTGTILADIPTINDTVNYVGILEMSEGTLQAGFADKNGAQTISNAGTIDSDVLTNITITYNGDVYTVYKDGVQTAQQSGITRTLFDNNSLQLEVGFGNNNIAHYHSPIPQGTPGSNDFYGFFHRFSYFNRALGPAEVASLYQSEKFITT